MSQSPYSTARRVFCVMDHGPSHRGEASVRRLTQALVAVHGPIHASWLNQIEIYFSIVQRKVLTPKDFPRWAAVTERLANFERYFKSIASPFKWKFTRASLNALVARMHDRWAQSQPLKLAAQRIRVRTSETDYQSTVRVLRRCQSKSVVRPRVAVEAAET